MFHSGHDYWLRQRFEQGEPGEPLAKPPSASALTPPSAATPLVPRSQSSYASRVPLPQIVAKSFATPMPPSNVKFAVHALLLPASAITLPRLLPFWGQSICSLKSSQYGL